MSGGKNYYGDATINYVFTRAPSTSERENLQFVSESTEEFVGNLKKDGKNILLIGGDLAKSFFEAGLTGELILGIQPTISGSGLPLFPPHKNRPI